jgi:hypothetical protein
MDIILPPDSDGDVGGNISVGKSCMDLSPSFGKENLSQYVLVATNEEENSLVISASKIDLTGIDFDSEFSSYLFYTELGIIRDLSDGIFDSSDVIAAFYIAGYPEGILLTPFGSSSILYSFSIGREIGSVNSSEFGAEKDTDLDDIPDNIDNCPLISNFGQEDTDGDGQGDVCDDDLDGDGVKNDIDNCLHTANFSQSDFDGDGQGSACDNDIDGDGVTNDDDGCEWTTVGDVVNQNNGCSIDQLCPCEGPRETTVFWRNHGKYVSCIAKTAEFFAKDGLITIKEKGAIVSAAAGSSCGQKKNKYEDR